MAEQKLEPFSESQERMGTAGMRIMSVLNTWIFKASGGRLGGKFVRGAPVLLLNTRGARSGEPRTTPLIYLADGEDFILVASKGGMSHSPGWYHNLVRTPDCSVQIGRVTRELRARRASDEEKAAYWPKLLAVYRDYDDYQTRTPRNIPVMVLSPR